MHLSNPTRSSSTTITTYPRPRLSPSMASLLTFPNPFSSLNHKPPPPPLSPPPPISISLLNPSSSTQYLAISPRRRRGISVVTSAGPSSTSYIFAFVFPLSLLAVTIFAASRIADRLDQKFLEEQAVNQEILEADEDGDNDGDGSDNITKEQEPAPPRKRNRPKREVEASSTS